MESKPCGLRARADAAPSRPRCVARALRARPRRVSAPRDAQALAARGAARTGWRRHRWRRKRKTWWSWERQSGGRKGFERTCCRPPSRAQPPPARSRPRAVAVPPAPAARWPACPPPAPRSTARGWSPRCRSPCAASIRCRHLTSR